MINLLQVQLYLKKKKVKKVNSEKGSKEPFLLQTIHESKIKLYIYNKNFFLLSTKNKFHVIIDDKYSGD